MRGTASSLMRFLDGSQKRFVIPVYQRNYDWKKENCQQLFDDLVNVIKEGKKPISSGASCRMLIAEMRLY